MARQKGLMKYIGTIGDVRHFKIKGQPGFYAGLVGGPTAQQVKTAPDFVVAAFNPADLISAPAGSTHFRLINALAVLSDFSFNPTTGSYEPDDAVNNELNVVNYSDYIPLNTPYAGDTISAALPGAPTLANNVTVVQCIGIEFFQEVNGNYYPFASGNCLKIEDAF